ncbi:hypothetical protein [Sporosarcina newyorkensis]|uniref:hypothetical protein n=1 Tax=Sporosarcina newyorkensis TaxID=759851 RepID=UPI003CFD40FE
MQNNFQETAKTAREFRDLSSDLLSSNYTTFDTALNFFKSFCDQNQIIQEILDPILSNQYKTDDWFNNAVKNRSSMAGSGDPTLPTKQIDSLKVIYDILWDTQAKQTIINLIFNTMFTKKYDEMIRRFNDNFTRRLVRYIIRQLEDKIDLVKPQGIAATSNTWNFSGPTNFANQSSNFTQNIQVNNPDILELVNEMRNIIESSHLNFEEKADGLETIDMIESEVSKPAPSKTKIEKLIAFLPTVESLMSLGETIIEKLPL